MAQIARAYAGRSFKKLAQIAAFSSLGLLLSTPVWAQTWTGGRTTPSLKEIFAIDATGETDWLYGQEDLAGDGIETFQQQEQSIDLRTAYAAADMQRFWARTYVSDQNAVGGNVTVYVFIDSDQSVVTGGTAVAPEIDMRFTTDASPGGYDYVVGVRGNGSITQIWQWSNNPQPGQYIGMAPNPAEATAETGTDTDPIQINAEQHGYLQAMIDLNVIGLTSECRANLYVRSVNDTAALGAGDLEVGQVSPCVPADGNNDGIPDVVIPPTGCTSDAQCPQNGVCVNGQCKLAVPCLVDTDCAAGETCTMDNRCVPVPSGSCSVNTDCVDLICTGGQCGPCDLAGNQCDAGFRCGPDGHCYGGNPGGCLTNDTCGDQVCVNGQCTACTVGGSQCGDGRRCGDDGRCYAPDVQGGAFTCAVEPGSDPLDMAGLASMALAFVLRRRRKALSKSSAKGSIQ